MPTFEHRPAGLTDPFLPSRIRRELNASGELAALLSHLKLSYLDLILVADLLECSQMTWTPPLVLVLGLLLESLDQGSLCRTLDPGQCAAQFSHSLRITARRWVEEFIVCARSGRYDDLLARDRQADRPLVWEAQSRHPRIYFQRYYCCEMSLKQGIQTLLDHPLPPLCREDAMERLIQELYASDSVIRTGPLNQPIIRDPDQCQAIALALSASFAIVSGGPGTGKTSLLVNLLRSLHRSGIAAEQMCLAAPTGRAAQKMTEAIQKNIASIQRPTPQDLSLLSLQGETLHRLLGYSQSRNVFRYSAAFPLPARVVVIDEVSMVDVVMLTQLVQAIDPATTRVIFMGDKDQLPSVEAGAVFAEMIPRGRTAKTFHGKLVVLQRSYRSGARLNRLANEVKQGRWPGGDPVAFSTALAQNVDHWSFCEPTSTPTFLTHIAAWAGHHYGATKAGEGYADWIRIAREQDGQSLHTSSQGRQLLDRLFTHVERARILALVHKGPAGTMVANGAVSAFFEKQLGLPVHPETGLCCGALVMITRNAPPKGLFNGDVGVALQDRNSQWRVYFQRSRQYMGFSVEALPHWEIAFTMTVHKSQGSEFDHVLLLLPPQSEHRILSREVIYTGITRAKKDLIVYGHRTVLEAALASEIRRESGFNW
jgi:exodeoxyribonuclease V alpha subunit